MFLAMVVLEMPVMRVIRADMAQVVRGVREAESEIPHTLAFTI